MSVPRVSPADDCARDADHDGLIVDICAKNWARPVSATLPTCPSP
jgi:hypothetical protein